LGLEYKNNIIKRTIITVTIKLNTEVTLYSTHFFAWTAKTLTGLSLSSVSTTVFKQYLITMSTVTSQSHQKMNGKVASVTDRLQEIRTYL
jgi:membrane protein implicated in regulation of membrane protease activity